MYTDLRAKHDVEVRKAAIGFFDWGRPGRAGRGSEDSDSSAGEEIDRGGIAMAKTRVSIYLIKKDYQSDEDIIKDAYAFCAQVIEGVGTFYGKRSYSNVPKWVESMFGDRIDSSFLRTSSVSAVLLVPVQIDEDVTRYFALTFGHGRLMLEQSRIEERFGLKTVLNVADANSLRRINKTTVAGNAMKASEQLPKKSSIGDFSMDIERDLLEGVSVSIKEGDVLEGTVKGSEALNVSLEVDMDNIVDTLRAIYGIYMSDAYKASFDWIDRISSVKSQALIDSLDAKAIEFINDGSPDVWMAIPDLIEWEQISGFKIVGDNEIYQDILIDRVVSALSQQPLSNIKQLKDKRIRVIDSDGVTQRETWSSYNCLFGELELDGEQYCINGGKWFRVDVDYAQTVCDAYEEMPICDIAFPVWEDGCRESEYNKELQSAGGGSRALMDAKNISYGGGSSRIELCDVLINDGTFIHVKMYSGSAVLSHLFNQGLVSASLVKSDAAFRRSATQKLKKENPSFDFRLKRDSVHEVIYAIGTKDPGERPPIPFFSKVTLFYVKKQLEMLGSRVSLKAIHVDK